jgi:hypothetical protein
LYQETCLVIQNPEDYKTQGQPNLLTQEDKTFMTKLVKTDPGLFLDKIQGQVYKNSGTTVSIAAIHYCLTRRLGMTKKAKVYSICKNLVQKYTFCEEMESIPARFLVFTNKNSVCSKDLLCTHARSKKGKSALKFQNNLNPERCSLILAISVYSLIALTILDDCVDLKDFEHFLKWQLVC